MGDKFLAFASKVGAQRHLVAIRDAFATTIPLVFAGSLAVLLNNIHVMFGMEESFLPEFIRTFNGNVYWGSFAMIGFLVVILIGYNLGKHYDVNPILTGLVCLGSYIAITPQVFNEAWGAIASVYTSAASLFVGILVSIMASEIFVKLSNNKKLIIKMPEGVPPAVAKSFAALIPGVVTMYAVVIVIGLVEILYNWALKPEEVMTIFAIINELVAAPIRGLADSLPAALMVAFFNHLLWAFSLHGSNIMEGIMQPVYFPLLEANIEAFAAGNPIPHIVTKQMFDIYVYMGGSGITLGLIIAIFLSSKSEVKRAIAKLSFGPGIFNINEPMMYGIPIVLNPILVIPFILAPMITTVTTYFALSMNLAGRTIAFIPWSTPPIVSALIGTDKPIGAIILQIINLTISVLIYIPFVKLSDRAEKKMEQGGA